MRSTTVTNSFQNLTKDGDYSLVICEKPNAARQIANALGDDIKSVRVLGVEVFSIMSEGKRYLICSASGHLYSLANVGRRSIFPVYDVGWVAKHEVERKSQYITRRIDAIREIAGNAHEFINACDFDQEGETIGYNILKYACAGREASALRAKFSTLTGDELRQAFKNAKQGLGGRMAEAGRTRHVIDFLYGVNLSRALSEAFLSSGRGYRTMSIGRVQGPTLAFVMDREIEIRSHVPVPYWKLSAILNRDGMGNLTASYEKDRIMKKTDAKTIVAGCKKRNAKVESIEKSTSQQSPPTPFNLGDLQREAYRTFGYPPSMTLSIAERLYLNALISYPRTSSQKIPPSINCRTIISGLSRIHVFHDDATKLLGMSRLVPKQGVIHDSAHPAIHPTGNVPKSKLDVRTFKLYDLIVRRFFSLFGQNVIRENISIKFLIGEHGFGTSGRRLVRQGWTRYYSRYIRKEDSPLPDLEEGEILRVIRLNLREKMEKSPPRYNQSTLLGKMEQEGIGTKATRAEVIKTIIGRGYVTGSKMEATEVAESIVATMKNHSPLILSSEMTAEMENELEKLEYGTISSDEIIERVIDRVDESLYSMKQHEAQIGRDLSQATSRNDDIRRRLGPCPVCGKGELIMIKSSSTKKRFVACSTKYQEEKCSASAPLPQRGVLKPLKGACKSCKWPIIQTRYMGRPWKLCINQDCPSKLNRGKKRIIHA